jgi:hypothetical protein
VLGGNDLEVFVKVVIKMKVGYKITLWLISLTDKLKKYYGIGQQPMFVTYRVQKCITREMLAMEYRLPNNNLYDFVKKEMEVEMFESVRKMIHWKEWGDFKDCHTIEAKLVVYDLNNA